MTAPDRDPVVLGGAFGGLALPGLGDRLREIAGSAPKPGGMKTVLTPEERAARAARLAAGEAAFAADAADLDAESYERGKEVQRTYRRKRYEAARPAAFAESSFDRLLPQQDAGGTGRGWLDSPARILLPSGPSGHGKSDLAFAIGNEAIGRGMWVEAWSAAELVQMLKPLPKHARNDERRTARQEDAMWSAKECDLLILDDLGGETSGGYVAEDWRSQLLEILSARDGHPHRRTIVTFNGGTTADQPDEAAKKLVKLTAFRWLESQYDSRVATRLRNQMVGIWVEGECLRKVSDWSPF